jgi:hypothetical protein
MRTKRYPFEGAWDVAALEYRVRGRWRCVFEPKPDDWSIGFLPDGRYTDVFRPEGGKKSSNWSFDRESGIISLTDTEPPQFVRLCIFDGTCRGGYLSFFDDSPHIRPDRASILDHHAHMRLRLVAPHTLI